MIPPLDILLQVYDTETVEALEKLRHHTVQMKPQQAKAVLRRFVDKRWPTEAQRINNTHWITVKSGGMGLMRWNRAQRELYKLILELEAAGEPGRIIIVKARQLGISAFMQSLQYDRVSYHPGTNSMTVNYEDKVTEELFRKAKMIHDSHMGALPTTRNPLDTIQFAPPHNGAFFTSTARSVGSGRSMTYQSLHCSELPLWNDPDGTLYGLSQSCPLKPGTLIVIESTARGAFGMFYDLWNAAVERTSNYVPFFAPWHWDEEYTLAFVNEAARRAFKRSLTPKDKRYQETHGLTDEQMNWRAYKTKSDLFGDEAMFRQEFPITADEAFLTSGSPAFDPEWVQDLRMSVRPPLWTGDPIYTSQRTPEAARP